MERVQVLISGAGPAGIIAAYRLAQRGVDVMLLEGFSGPPEDFRAATFNPPTLDMLEELGWLEELEAGSLRAPIYQYRHEPSGSVLSFDLTELASDLKHPYRLQAEQYKLVRLGARKLAGQSNVVVKFQHQLVNFEQDDTGVTAYAETPFGIASFRADYLIAAEGASLIARKSLGVQFEGVTFQEKFLSLTTNWPLEQHFDDLAHVSYVVGAQGWQVLLKTPALWHVLLPVNNQEADGAIVSDIKKNAVFDGLIGVGAAVQTAQRSIVRVHQRVANRYDHGRVLLMADSAHLNIPLGGFGMNSGIHDAWNLSDKLDRIINEGVEAAPLLQLYDRERRVVMHDFIQLQIEQKRQYDDVENGEALRLRDLEAVMKDDHRRRQFLLHTSMGRA